MSNLSQMTTIKLTRDNFLPLFYELHKTKSMPQRVICNRGGFGSGKTISVVQYLLTRCLVERNFKVLVVMKTSSNLDRTIMSEFDSMIKHFQVSGSVKKNMTKKQYTFTNNASILFTGLDDPEKLKGINLIKYIFVEEANNIDLDDYYALDGRLRGGKGAKYTRQILLNFNPVSIENWIYKKFYEDGFDREMCVYFKTTWMMNRFIDEDYKKSQEAMKFIDINKYNIQTRAEWGLVTTGNELFKTFRPEKHVKKINYDPKIPLHLVFDENVVPYSPLLVAQVVNSEVRIIFEIAAKDPFNSLIDVCELFKKQFPNHTEGIFIYGDATSKKRDMKTKDENFFGLAIKYLEKYRPNMRVPNSNPGVAIRSTWLNAIFGVQQDGIRILIDPSCNLCVTDLQVVKEAADGTMLKKVYRENGVSFQKYGHFSDCVAYLMTYLFRESFDKFRNGGIINIDTSYITDDMNKFRY